MFIKTVRWKKKRVGKLLRYIDNDKGRGPADDAFTIYHNIPIPSLTGAILAFEENDEFRKVRKNGVSCYHEILSFHPKDKHLLTRVILEDCSEKYIETRCPNALVYARAHLHDDHWHIHFAISGTEYRSSKTLRMDDATFEKVRYEIESYQVRKYPELEHSVVYLKKERRKRKDRHQEDRNTRKERVRQMERRTGSKEGEKTQAITLVRECLQQSQSFLEFEHRLQSVGMQLYQYRGKTTGILFGKRKYRFKTLDMDKAIIRELERNKTNREQYQNRIRQLRIMQDAKANQRDRSR
ncbi:MAG: relaxase/mobilization nuclease domain-containing protein [Bacteroidota bacterium]